MIGYKVLRDEKNYYLAKLEILGKVIEPNHSRKKRTSRARVLKIASVAEIEPLDTWLRITKNLHLPAVAKKAPIFPKAKEYLTVKHACFSSKGTDKVYSKGKVVESTLNPCTVREGVEGIHFFANPGEALCFIYGGYFWGSDIPKALADEIEKLFKFEGE